MDQLASIELQLDDRIDALDIMVRRLDKTRSTLRKCVTLAHQSHASTAAKAATILEKDTESEKCNDVQCSEFDKLDGILNLAKEIRALNTSKTASSKTNEIGSISSIVNSKLPKGSSAQNTKVSSRQTLGEALVSKPAANEPPQLTKEMLADNAATAFRDDVREQLLFLSRYKIPTLVPLYHLNKAKYVEESRFLSKLSRRSQHASSAPHQVISSAIPPTVLDTSPSGDANSVSPLHSSSGDNVVAKLATQFQVLIASYDRYLKQRLNHESFKVSQLSADDKRSVLTLWLKGRKLIELFEHYMKARFKLPCNCEHCVAARRKHMLPRQYATDELEHSVPVCTPIHPPSVQSDTDLPLPKRKSKGKSSLPDLPATETVWSYNAKRLVEEYHRAYQSKVMFVVESAVGQDQLRSTVQALKGCCEAQGKAVPGPGAGARAGSAQGADLQNKWVDSLKQFRLVYSILVNEAQHMHHCMFLNK